MSNTTGNLVQLSEDEARLIERLRANKKEDAINEFINNPEVQEAALKRLQAITTGGVLTTKSYKIGTDYNEFILDVVAHKRTTGFVNFTQTKVLHMALDRLKELLPPVPPRSEAVRKEARNRNAIIASAIKSTKKKKEEQH